MAAQVCRTPRVAATHLEAMGALYVGSECDPRCFPPLPPSLLAAAAHTHAHTLTHRCDATTPHNTCGECARNRKRVAPEISHKREHRQSAEDPPNYDE